MEVLEEFINKFILEIKSAFPELESCEKQFVERINEVMFKTRSETGLDFKIEEEKLLSLIEIDIQNVSHVRIYTERDLEYLSRLGGHLSCYLILLSKNMHFNEIKDYFNDKLYPICKRY